MSSKKPSQKSLGPYSMTGFARVERRLAQVKLNCDIKSVNHRYLEVNTRLADVFKPMEAHLRQRLKEVCSRGKFEVSLSFSVDEAILQGEEVDEDLVRSLVAMAEKICAITGQSDMLDTATLLAWPGVMHKQQDLALEDFEAEAHALFADGLAQLLAHRQREGQALSDAIKARLALLEEHVQALRVQYPVYKTASEHKVRERIAQLNVEIDEPRLVQELVLLANKSDVSEELDRLDAHLQETKLTLGRGEPVGRRLDFLMQEFNREANTLSSKASHKEMTQVAIELKVLIEQMREQVQNIE